MRKAVRLLALFLLLACGLGAQEIFFERYPSGVDFWVMIPYQVLNFKQGEDTAQYQLSLSLKNAQGRQAANFERQLSVPAGPGWAKPRCLTCFRPICLPASTWRISACAT